MMVTKSRCRQPVEQYAPGWYQYPTPHGGLVYIYIGNNVLMS